MDPTQDLTLPAPTPSPVDPADHAATSELTLIGTTLHDTYKVVRFLAEGGMGRVYEAQHTRITTKRFALKVLHSELKHSVEVRTRFRREAEAAASIEHPNVVGVHDFGYTSDDRPFLVCDLLEGKDLGDVLRERGALPVPLAIRIVRQVCDALEAAHDRGVIHRDLKPENVFLVGSVDEPRTRVLDFGLSRVIELSEVQMTQTGMIMGTPAYMSPEQARGERGDHRIDVYGAGALLYVCLTGKAPFTEETASATVVAVLTGEPKRPCSLVPSLSPDLELVVQKAMARAADDRYATMRDFSEALARFDETAIVAVADAAPVSRATNGQAPPLPSTAKGVRGRAVWWLLFAVLVGALGLIGAGLGVLELLDRRLTQTEMILALVGVFGSVFTPGLLLLLRIRREYWNNSAKMVNLVGALRGPVLAGLVVYGLAGLVARGLDGAGKRLLEVTTPNASGWVGWAPFLFGVASVAALAALLRHKLLSSGKAGLLRRMTAGPVLVTLAVGGSGAILFAGFETMSNLAPDATPAGASAKATATAAPAATAAAAPRASAAPSGSAKK